MRLTAQKSTPQNNATTINILKKAQQAVDKLSEIFGYDKVKGLKELKKEQIYVETNKRAKNGLYQGEGITSILNIGTEEGKEKANQEDSILALTHPLNSDFKIALVADGMGGQGNGAAASHIATLLTKEWFESLPKDFYNQDNISLKYQNGSSLNISFEDAIKENLININEKIKELLGKSPGTTFSAVITRKKNGQDSITVVSIGDSKVLKVSANGQVEQLSKDDNILSKAIEEKAIYIEPNNPEVIYTSNEEYNDRAIYKPLQKDNNPQVLKEGDERFYKRNHMITDYLGCGQEVKELKRKLNQKFNGFISEHSFNQGDTLFLCSDGISDTLTNKEIADIVHVCKKPVECLKHIINKIYEAEKEKHKTGHNNPPKRLEENKWFGEMLKGSEDNMSAIIMEKGENDGR